MAARTASSWPGRKASKPKCVRRATAGSMSAVDSTARRGEGTPVCADLSQSFAQFCHTASRVRCGARLIACPCASSSGVSSATPEPDPMTQLSLETAMRENTWGAYQNALPGRWLVFHARGLYGSPRYACPRAPRRSRRLPARALRHDRLPRLEAPAVPVEPPPRRHRSRLVRRDAAPGRLGLLTAAPGAGAIARLDVGVL